MITGSQEGKVFNVLRILLTPIFEVGSLHIDLL